MREEIRKLLEDMILEVGQDVTNGYIIKNGLWEGLSIENVSTINRFEKQFLDLVNRAKNEKHIIFQSPTYDFETDTVILNEIEQALLPILKLHLGSSVNYNYMLLKDLSHKVNALLKKGK